MNYDDWERNDKIDAEFSLLRAENAELKKRLRQMVEAYKDLSAVDRGELCACGNEDCQEVVRAWELMDEASDQAKVALNLF